MSDASQRIHGAQYTVLMVPVIVIALAAQRQIVHGLTLGAVARPRR